MTTRKISFNNSVVASMMEEALAFSTAKTGAETRERTLDALRKGDCATCDYVKYSLAKGIAQYLGSIDNKIKSVYIYEPEYATHDEVGAYRLSTSINLLAWVGRKSAALDSIIASLDAALMEEKGHLPCPNATAECYSLDVKVVDNGEVSQRRGYGALVDSILVRPTKVWERSN